MKFMTALAILFIALKLCGVIGWAWWLVLLPLYGGAAIIFGIILVMLATGTLAASAAAIRKRRK